MRKITTIVASSATFLLAATSIALAQQGTPGRVIDGDAVVQPGAQLGPGQRGVNRDTGIPNDVDTGTLAQKSTATGGNVGGPAGRN